MTITIIVTRKTEIRKKKLVYIQIDDPCIIEGHTEQWYQQQETIRAGDTLVQKNTDTITILTLTTKDSCGLSTMQVGIF